MDPNLDVITFCVSTPDNLYHTCKYEHGKWWGMDNVCSSIDDDSVRWYTIRKLKQLMLIEIEDKWNGWEWVPID